MQFVPGTGISTSRFDAKDGSRGHADRASIVRFTDSCDFSQQWTLVDGGSPISTSSTGRQPGPDQPERFDQQRNADAAAVDTGTRTAIGISWQRRSATGNFGDHEPYERQ